MENYRSNSNKSKADIPKEEEHRVQSVVSAPAKKIKKSGFRKIGELIIQEDVENVGSYILVDVLIPAIKKAMYDVITNGADMFLFGGNRRPKSNGYASKVSYRSMYDDRREESRRSYSTTSYNFDDILIPNRTDAEEVIIRMNELIARYGLVRVTDFYELVGMTGSYTENRYGWTDISSAKVIRDRDGYIIKLPRPLPLD